eukprot:CAMPEP_0169278432 /NCGR_PEP_ID=MMETSP1016-20121227/54314_1 /TAXON_ID=342587 /ORGANISM="Karlodinium micrum, Strain CCMP2283" /LENGTH=80 /DNA_ID=CAMNT_0009366177 /DNA_START=78 /DNA_END=320 /DNA_ORIENTATION=-
MGHRGQFYSVASSLINEDRRDYARGASIETCGKRTNASMMHANSTMREQPIVRNARTFWNEVDVLACVRFQPIVPQLRQL